MKKTICIMSCVLVLLVACKEVYRYTFETFFAMSTVVNVTLGEEIKEVNTRQVITDIEKRMSRTIPESEIYRINSGGDIVLSADTVEIIEKSLEIAKATDYAFNPCMGALTDLWDITSGKNIVPSDKEIKDAISLCDASLAFVSDGRVEVPDGCKIDLGGVAKGYALQMAAENISECASKSGVDADFCISLGGNVAVSGTSQIRKNNGEKGWNVGITNPFDKSETIGTLLLESGYISVSGAYERFFEKDGKIYHHIFDGKTGYPAESDLAGTAVISDDGLCADALSTALFVMGLDRAREFYRDGGYDFEAVLVTNDGSVFVTQGLGDTFSINQKAVQINTEKVTIINR